MTAQPHAAASSWTAPKMPGWAANAFALLPGTVIRTASGDRPAETMRAGDAVQALNGAAGKVATAKRLLVEHAADDCLRQPWPIRFRAGSLADQQPFRDLLLLPWQPVEIAGRDRGKPPPAAADLVNGASIVQEPSPPREWMCIRTEQPASLVAEGVELIAAPASWPPAAPLLSGSAGAWLGSGQVGFALAGGSAHDALRDRLAARAATIGHKTSVDPDLRLVLAEQVLRPFTIGRIAYFKLPDHTLEARLASRSAVPAQIFDSGDTRRLGVPINAVLADGVGVPLDHWSLRDGWQGVETGWRWTDGSGRLLIPAGTRVVELVIAFVLPLYPLDSSVRAVALERDVAAG